MPVHAVPEGRGGEGERSPGKGGGGVGCQQSKQGQGERWWWGISSNNTPLVKLTERRTGQLLCLVVQDGSIR